MIPELAYSPISPSESGNYSPVESDVFHTSSTESHDYHATRNQPIGSPNYLHCHKPRLDQHPLTSPSPRLSSENSEVHHSRSLFGYDDSATITTHTLNRSPSENIHPEQHRTSSSKTIRASIPTPVNLHAHFHSPRFPHGHKLNREFARMYKLEDELGAGGYGFVMTAKHREEEFEVAVKFIIKDKVPDNAWMEDESIGRLPTEVMLLSFIDHPNIVKCLDLFEDPLYFYMVQELHGSPWSRAKKQQSQTVSMLLSSPSDTASTPSLSPSVSVDSLDSDIATPPPPNAIDVRHDSNGSENEELTHCFSRLAIPRPVFNRRPSHDLFECIEHTREKRLSESQARHIFRQVVDAVHYLDLQGISHRDIKDENLVVDQDLNVKLIDFGSAIIVDPAVEPRPHYNLFFGTSAYAAAEILRKKPYQAAPAEVWTLGVLLSYLLTGTSPFASVDDAISGRITLADCPPVSHAVLHVLKICLRPNPKERATIQEVKDHVWLRR